MMIWISLSVEKTKQMTILAYFHGQWFALAASSLLFEFRPISFEFQEMRQDSSIHAIDFQSNS